MALPAATTLLDSLAAGNLFDLRGVVAVVTGGGTVSQILSRHECGS